MISESVFHGEDDGSAGFDACEPGVGEYGGDVCLDCERVT
jgi:hypothetical protein